MLTAAGALVISYVDRFVIDIFVGRDALGIYTFYSTILIGLLSLGGSVSHQFLPKVIAGYAASVDAYRAALRSFFWSMLALASGTVIICGFAMAPMLSTCLDYPPMRRPSGCFMRCCPEFSCACWPMFPPTRSMPRDRTILS